MTLDKLILILVVAGAVLWCGVMLASAIAIFPYGLPFLVIFLIAGYIVYRIVRDRLENKEDDYYEKNVDR